MSRFDRWSHADMPGAEENRRIQAGIDAVMRDIIADPRKNPTAMPPSETVTVVGAPKVVTAGERGWQEEQPLTSPPGQDVIERLVNAELPHGPKTSINSVGLALSTTTVPSGSRAINFQPSTIEAQHSRGPPSQPLSPSGPALPSLPDWAWASAAPSALAREGRPALARRIDCATGDRVDD